MAIVDLLIHFVPGNPDRLSVDYHHMVPGVDVRGVARAVFPHQEPGNAGCHPTQNLVVGVDKEPFAFYFSFSRICYFHRKELYTRIITCCQSLPLRLFRRGYHQADPWVCRVLRQRAG